MLEYLDTVKSMYKNAKNSILKVPEMEAKVVEATSNEAWGPSSTQMREIARATHSYANFPIIMDTLWKRIDDEARNWRHILKGLVLLDFLVKNGSEQVIREARVHLMQVQRLYDFTFIEGDKDYGLTIREKSRQLSELLNDDERIHDEREKARVTAGKFSEAISSDTYHGGSGGGGGGGGYGGRSGGGGGGDYGRDYDNRGGRDYDRGGRDYGRRDEEPSYNRRRDDYDDRSPQPAPRGHIRAPSGGESTPAPSSQPNKSAPVDFFNLMDEPATKPAPSTDFFAAFPGESTPSAPSAPSTDFFAASAPPTTTNQEPEWDEFTKADAPPPEDTKNPWANKKLFDLDNLTNPAAHSATGKKPLGVSATSPIRPLGSIPTATPVSNTLGGGVPLGGGAPLGGGLGRGYAPTVGVTPQVYGAPMGAGGRGMAMAPGYGMAPTSGMMMAPGYGVAPMGVGAPGGYGAQVYGAPQMMMAPPGMMAPGYGVAPMGMAPGIRPAQPGYPPR